MLIRLFSLVVFLFLYALFFSYVIRRYKSNSFASWKPILSFYISRLSLGLLITIITTTILFTGFLIFNFYVSQNTMLIDNILYLAREKQLALIFMPLILFYFFAQIYSCVIMHKIIGKHFGDSVVVIDLNSGQRLFKFHLKTSLSVLGNYFFRNAYFIFVMLPVVVTVPIVKNSAIINTADIIFALLFSLFYIPTSMLVSFFIAFSRKYSNFTIKTVKIK